jgi:hypothetical protein
MPLSNLMSSTKHKYCIIEKYIKLIMQMQGFLTFFQAFAIITTASNLISVPGSLVNLFIPRNNFLPDGGSEFMSTHGLMLQEATSQLLYSNTREYHDFKLIYRSNGGDYCNMKTARSILSKTSGRVAIVYRKKGDSNLIGFTTDKQFSSDDSSFQTWM